jgi:hypothetical protein
MRSPQLFLNIGIDLDEAVPRGVEPHLERMIGFVLGGYPTDEHPGGGRLPDISF